MEKFLPVLIGLMGNETIRSVILQMFTRAQQEPQGQIIQEAQNDIVAIRLDAKMRERIKRYQVDNGLEADGVPGSKTLTVMLSKLGG